MATCIGQITGPLASASQAADACAIFHTIIDAPKPSYGTASGYDEAGSSAADGDIIFENVNFVYPSRPNVKVLDNLSLRFPAGKMTAIVGPSGSGKSTIVGILQRWYEFNGDPTTNQLILWLRNGLVSVGGRKLSDIDIKWWRNQIGLVQQDNILFNTTIYKNVEYGLIGTEWEHASDSKKSRLIRTACKDAFADEFISRLPDGYETTVGESGIKISGGQRQRLAIARAIVKQPKVLILDEATSAIDVRSEQIVQAALDRACQGRTTIVIAHRLGTVRKADNIILLRKGAVVQQGTHESLMAEVDGPYHMLATAQQLNMGAREIDGSDLNVTSEDSANPSFRLNAEEDSLNEKMANYIHDNNSVSDDKDSDKTLLGDDDDAPLIIMESPVSRFGSFGELLSEQKSRWILYSLILLAALGAGGKSSKVSLDTRTRWIRS